MSTCFKKKKKKGKGGRAHRWMTWVMDYVNTTIQIKKNCNYCCLVTRLAQKNFLLSLVTLSRQGWCVRHKVPATFLTREHYLQIRIKSLTPIFWLDFLWLLDVRFCVLGLFGFTGESDIDLSLSLSLALIFTNSAFWFYAF